MKGSLSDQPLAELVREISRHGFSGTLRLEYDRAKAAVYFENGIIVFAAANLKSLRLREYLRKRELVSEKEIEKLGGQLSDLDLATALCTAGLLRRDQADAVLSVLVADVLRVTMLWTTGTWDFSERKRLGYPMSVTLDVNNLLREAGQRLPLAFISSRFRNPSEMITRANSAAQNATTSLSPSESFLLSRLDTPTKVQELVALSGLRELDAHRLLYGLALCGLITREYWHHAFRAEGKDVVAAEQTSALRLDEAEIEANKMADLHAFLQRMDQANDYYEVIDLAREAQTTDIKNAYYALARKYHPDRFHLQSGTPQHSRISSAFARITEAYETLIDPTARSAYDAGLDRAREFAGARKSPKAASAESRFDFAMAASNGESEEADQCFRDGINALQNGQLKVAVAQLATAARLSPRDPRYRAHYGRALAATEQTRRLAEGELQAAVKLEPSNAVYRTMLAELYFDLRFPKRAQTELQRALALDPENAKARALLRRIEKSRRKV